MLVPFSFIWITICELRSISRNCMWNLRLDFGIQYDLNLELEHARLKAKRHEESECSWRTTGTIATSATRKTHKNSCRNYFPRIDDVPFLMLQGQNQIVHSSGDDARLCIVRISTVKLGRKRQWQVGSLKLGSDTRGKKWYTRESYLTQRAINRKMKKDT